MSTQAVFIIPPKVHLLDIAGPAHIFYEAADYGAPVTAFYASIAPQQPLIESSSHLWFSNLTDYNSLQLHKNDLVFIPGLDGSLLLNDLFLKSTEPFGNWLLEQHAKGVIICSVCTGAFLLAETGLLDGRPCTTHWKYIERLGKRYPQLMIRENCLFVAADTVYTSAGVASGIDLALFMVEHLWGSAFAARIAREAVVFARRSASDPQLSVFMQYRNHLDNRIHTVQDLLSQWLDRKLNIEDLAAQVHMSARNLTRLFKSTTGVTIGQYIEKLRVERSARMIGEGHTMQAAASACGLKSTNQLRYLLRKYEAVAPVPL